LQQQFGQQNRQQGQMPQQGQTGRQGAGDRQGQSLADRQEQLRQFIDQMRREGTGGEALDRAERDMGAARDRLRAGDYSGAFDAQARAMENMRQTLRELQNQRQAGRTGQDGNMTARRDQYDPLGRPIGNRGRADGDTAVPDQNASDRARALLGEIRRRSGERQRPAAELDYLNRLLDRF
jgi:hypothetical protein